MTIDKFLSTIGIDRVPINNVHRHRRVEITAGELRELLTDAYNAGRQETESELATVIALNPLESEVAR